MSVAEMQLLYGDALSLAAERRYQPAQQLYGLLLSRDGLPQPLRAKAANDLGVLLTLRGERKAGRDKLFDAVRLDTSLDVAWSNIEYLDENQADCMEAKSRLYVPGLADYPGGLALQAAVKEPSVPRIPNVFHACFGFAPDFGGRPFSLVHYLAIKSAWELNHPDVIRFYYCHEPGGPWWERAKPFVEMVKIEPPREIFGNPLRHIAHQADVVRLQAIIEHGGVYIDLDVLCLRPFTPLLIHPYVMGVESGGGLCNAVMLGEPQAAFARGWLENYRSFRSSGHDDHWAEHSVQLPALLASRHPDDVHVVDYKKFFWPMYGDQHMAAFFRGNGDTRFCADSYCVHLWEQITWDRFLKELTVNEIRAGKSEFHRLAAPFLDKPESVTNSSRTLRYDLGGVGKSPNGRISVNLSASCDIRHDILDLDGLIPKDDSVDEFYLSHTLEHVPIARYREFLCGMFRKLRPGGRVLIIQTDAGDIIRQWIDGDLSFRAMRACLFTPAHRISNNPLDQHQNMWTPEALIQDFEAVGYQAEAFDAGQWSFDMNDEFVPEECLRCHGMPIRNLGVIATKPFLPSVSDDDS